MARERNPFRILTAERLETDATFLHLFSPYSLDILSEPGRDYMALPAFILSAPGGGKTSILRLFTTTALAALHERRGQEEFEGLHQRLRDLGAFSEVGPSLLGVWLSCSRNFSDLETLQVDPLLRLRLFFALLNVRVVLVALQTALASSGLTYPDDLHRLKVDLPPQLQHMFPSVIASGGDLNRWASEIEKTISATLDSVTPIQTAELPGHDEFHAPDIVDANRWTLDGEAVWQKTLVMLDDIHELSPSQRDRVSHSIETKRGPSVVWIAGRLEFLSTERLFEGAKESRDYLEVRLENRWRQAGGGKRFRTFLEELANRRVKFGPPMNVQTFADCLEFEPTADELADAPELLKTAKRRVLSRTQGGGHFAEWIESRERAAGTLAQLIGWRSLEIVLNRHRHQSRLVEGTIPLEILAHEETADVRSAAELMICKEGGLPYYYGFDRFAALSSYNVQQFLMLAAEIFELAEGRDLSGKKPAVPAKMQDEAIRNVARKQWRDMTRSIAYGEDVRRLLDAIGSLAKTVTYRERAPYSPGVLGVAISSHEHGLLRKRDFLETHPELVKLRRVLQSAINNNMIQPVSDRRVKGGEWTVFYLNRLFCPLYDLPVVSSQFQHATLKQLNAWMREGWRPTRRLLRAAAAESIDITMDPERDRTGAE